MDSPPLDNQTEFEAHPQLLLTPDGERLTVIVKATFEVHGAEPELRLAPQERARAVRSGDIPWEVPEVDSIMYPCDVTPEKAGTDVVVVATAYPPQMQPSKEFDAYVRVGALQKSLRIFGLRVWEAGGAGLSSPRPISRLDVRYDYAWGGRDDSVEGKIAEEARNPVGRGVAVSASSLTHQLAPHIEDPNHLMRSASTRPPPAGIGALGRSFSPRRELTGTYDELWKEYRCPLPPKDQSPSMHQCASPGLVAVPPLRGNEACALLNLSPLGPLQFNLPAVQLVCEFQCQGRAPELVIPTLNTVLIDTWVMGHGDPACVELVWCASTKAPRRATDCLIVIRET